MRKEGWIVERADDAAGAVARLAAGPAIDVLLVDGMPTLDRERVLLTARENGVWCVYLQAGDNAALPASQRAELVAALPIDADDETIAATVRAILAARRSRTAG